MAPSTCISHQSLPCTSFQRCGRPLLVLLLVLLTGLAPLSSAAIVSCHPQVRVLSPKQGSILSMRPDSKFTRVNIEYDLYWPCGEGTAVAAPPFYGRTPMRQDYYVVLEERHGHEPGRLNTTASEPIYLIISEPGTYSFQLSLFSKQQQQQQHMHAQASGGSAATSNPYDAPAALSVELVSFNYVPAGLPYSSSSVQEAFDAGENVYSHFLSREGQPKLDLDSTADLAQTASLSPLGEEASPLRPLRVLVIGSVGPGFDGTKQFMVQYETTADRRLLQFSHLDMAEESETAPKRIMAQMLVNNSILVYFHRVPLSKDEWVSTTDFLESSARMSRYRGWCELSDRLQHSTETLAKFVSDFDVVWRVNNEHSEDYLAQTPRLTDPSIVRAFDFVGRLDLPCRFGRLQQQGQGQGQGQGREEEGKAAEGGYSAPSLSQPTLTIPTVETSRGKAAVFGAVRVAVEGRSSLLPLQPGQNRVSSRGNTGSAILPLPSGSSAVNEWWLQDPSYAVQQTSPAEGAEPFEVGLGPAPPSQCFYEKQQAGSIGMEFHPWSQTRGTYTEAQHRQDVAEAWLKVDKQQQEQERQQQGGQAAPTHPTELSDTVARHLQSVDHPFDSTAEDLTVLHSQEQLFRMLSSWQPHSHDLAVTPSHFVAQHDMLRTLHYKTMVLPGTVNAMQVIARHHSDMFFAAQACSSLWDLGRQPEERVGFSFNGSMSAIFTDAARKAPQPRPLVIAFIGRLSREKGLGLYLSAVADLLNRLRQTFESGAAGQTGAAALEAQLQLVRFVVIGTHADEGYLNSMLRYADKLGLGGRVHFLGFLPPSQLQQWYKHRCLDVVVAPYVRPLSETFGLVLTEAMNAEVPVIHFNIGGISDYGRDGLNSRIPKSFTPRDLSDAMIGLINSPSKRKEMGKAARRFVMRHLRQAPVAALMAKVLREERVGNLLVYSHVAGSLAHVKQLAEGQWQRRMQRMQQEEPERARAVLSGQEGRNAEGGVGIPSSLLEMWKGADTREICQAAAGQGRVLHGRQRAQVREGERQEEAPASAQALFSPLVWADIVQLSKRGYAFQPAGGATGAGAAAGNSKRPPLLYAGLQWLQKEQGQQQAAGAPSSAPKLSCSRLPVWRTHLSLDAADAAHAPPPFSIHLSAQAVAAEAGREAGSAVPEPVIEVSVELRLEGSISKTSTAAEAVAVLAPGLADVLCKQALPSPSGSTTGTGVGGGGSPGASSPAKKPCSLSRVLSNAGGLAWDKLLRSTQFCMLQHGQGQGEVFTAASPSPSPLAGCQPLMDIVRQGVAEAVPASPRQMHQQQLQQQQQQASTTDAGAAAAPSSPAHHTVVVNMGKLRIALAEQSRSGGGGGAGGAGTLLFALVDARIPHPVISASQCEDSP